MAKTLFSNSEAARAVPCYEGKLRVLEKRGLIKPERIGRNRVYTTNDIHTVRAYLRAHGRCETRGD